MEDSLRLFLSLADPAHAGNKRDCPFASPSPSPQTTTFLPYSPPPSPYPYLSNYAAAPPTESLLEKPRAPPARPIPLNFPNYVPKAVPRPLSRQSMRHLRRAILNARRPTENNDAVLDLMNVQLHPNVPLDSPELVPADFLPERPFLYDADLEAMLAELSIENEDAFREVLRQKPREGRPKPRVAYSRNFYGSLEDIRRYCDASSDNYYEVEEDADKTQGTESKKPPSGNDNKEVDAEGDSNMIDSTTTSDDKSTASPAPASDSANASDSNNTTKKTKEMYTGLRLGNSTQLPPGTRTGAMRNLLKMVMHKFTCRDYDVSSRERMRIRDINVPPQMVMYNFIVARLPADRALARARHVEGPLLGVSVRHETVFDEELHRKLLEDEGRDRNEVGECLGAKVDLLREVGSALVVALQRNREGKKREEEQERVTKSWWWAREKRWGGGETRWGMLANEVFEEEDPSWSPTERELQLAKREKTQEEMRKVDEAAGKVGGDMRVEDLLAKSETQAQQPNTAPNSATIGLLSESSVRIPTLTPTAPATGTSSSNSGPIEADETSPTSPTANNGATGSGSGSTNTTSGMLPDRPPKKKHRLTLADRVPQHTLSPQEREDKRERDMNERAEFREGRRLMYTAPMRRKWFREWTNVRPNSVAWDEKVIWRGIGRPGVDMPKEATAAAADAGGEKGKGIEEEGTNTNPSEKEAGKGKGTWDEVFELSCVNHHVSLVKVRVSTRYLNWLENGDPNETSTPILARTTRPFEVKDQSNDGTKAAAAPSAPSSQNAAQQQQPQQAPVGEDEDILQAWRTPYYDLFDMAQRKEFFVALWRVMCWLCRAEVPVAEWEKVGTLRKEMMEKKKMEEGKAEAVGEGKVGDEKASKEVEMTDGKGTE